MPQFDETEGRRRTVCDRTAPDPATRLPLTMTSGDQGFRRLGLTSGGGQMGDRLVLVLVVAAVLVLLTAVVVWVRPLLRSVRPVTSVKPEAAPAPGPGAARFGPPLARGFGYLFSPLGLPRRRSDLSDRLDRALQRIGRVDPYATHRRIGLALLATGSPEAPGQGGPAPAAHPPTGSTPWPPVSGPVDERETGQ